MQHDERGLGRRAEFRHEQPDLANVVAHSVRGVGAYRVGTCVRLADRTMRNLTPRGTVVDCTTPHHLEIIAMATLPKDYLPGSGKDDVSPLYQGEGTCPRKLGDAYVGATGLSWHTSTATLPVTPTRAQVLGGARWVACALVRLGSTADSDAAPRGSLAVATVTQSLRRGVSNSWDPVFEWGRCRSDVTGRTSTRAGRCSSARPDDWIEIRGAMTTRSRPSPYPGTKAQIARAVAVCAKTEPQYSAFAARVVTRFVTKADWAAGDRGAWCYIRVRDFDHGTPARPTSPSAARGSADSVS